MVFNLISMRLLFIIFLIYPVNLRASESRIYLNTVSTSGHLQIKDWKSLRDARVVKQNLDYSCGAASMATLLNEFYGENLSEIELLLAMDKGDMRASFADMEAALPQFGYRALAYAANYEQLTRLRIPVIVFLKHRRNEHFSVVRGINESTVWLADSSLGNRSYSRAQFLEMWETRSEEDENAELKGRMLAIVPLQPESAIQSNFFTRDPHRQTAQALRLLSIRLQP